MKAAGAAPRLLIDAGNSRVKWALDSATGERLATGAFDQPASATGSPAGAPTPLSARQPLPTHVMAAWNNLPRPAAAWISNVAGVASDERLAALLEAHWPHLPRHTIRTAERACGVINGYREPAQLGSDRWAGLIGARAAYPGEHLLLVTLGTATTLEVLLADGRFVGGLIAPGWGLMMQALGQHTAQLPLLTPGTARGILSDPFRDAAALAVDTPTALSRGCLLAQAALIERVWRDTLERLAANVRVILGGGAADAVATELRFEHTRHDHLVLAGLGLIAAEALCTQDER